MSAALLRHPLAQALDCSAQQLLVLCAQPVQWRDAQELALLGQGYTILGWLDDGRAFTLCRAEPLGEMAFESGSGWRVPELSLTALLHAQLEGEKLRQNLISQIQDTNSTITETTPQEPSPPALTNAAGWCLALGLPAITMTVLATDTSALAQWLTFFAALGAGLCVWIMGLAPPLVGALLALLLMMVGNHLPVQQALGGLSNGSFFLLLGLFGCSAAVQHSGLMQRLLNTLLRPLPHTSRVFQACLVLIGSLMTLCIPSTSGRLQLIAPMTKVLTSTTTRATLTLAALSGCTLFSTSFLLGNAANFIVLGILPEHWQPQVNWMSWFQCAALYTLVVSLGLVVSIVLSESNSQELVSSWTSPDSTRLSSTQWVTLLALAMLALGAGLSNLHHIEMPWIALFVLLLLIATQTFSLQRLRSDIPWSILLYLVCTVGIARGFTHMGIQDWLLQHVTALEQLMQDKQALFLLVLTISVLLLRLMLPAVVCITTLCAVLIPLGDTHGMHPLVLGFVIVTASEIWFFPHQSSDYLMFCESMELRASEARALLLRNACIQGSRILGLLASIPYWQHLGFVQ